MMFCFWVMIMTNIIKGVLYTGVAAAIGVGAYLIGKYKHMGKISLTMAGLALVLYVPKGCETIDNYMHMHENIEKARLNGESRKDSLRNVAYARVSFNDASRRYIKNMDDGLQELLERNKDLTRKYNQLLSGNAIASKTFVEEKKQQYDTTLQSIIKQNTYLTKRLDVLKTELNKNYISANHNTDSKDTINQVRKSDNNTNVALQDNPLRYPTAEENPNHYPTAIYNGRRVIVVPMQKTNASIIHSSKKRR